MRDVGRLTFLPMCLAFPFCCIGEAIRTGLNNPSHALAKAVANVLEPRCTALIFGTIVQKRSNGEVFVATILQDRCSHSQQVSHVRDAGSFSDLSSVNVGCIEERAIKSIG